MIVLEFRSPKNFDVAIKILKRNNIPFKFEKSMTDWHPDLIFFFEPDVRTRLQREVVSRVRALESKENHQRGRMAQPNLALPP